MAGGSWSTTRTAQEEHEEAANFKLVTKNGLAAGKSLDVVQKRSEESTVSSSTNVSTEHCGDSTDTALG